MKNYTYVVGESFLNVTNIKTGNSFTITKEDARFVQAKNLLKEEKFEECERFLDVKVAVVDFASGTRTSDFVVSLENGVVYYSYKGGAKQTLSNGIVDRIIAMSKEGFNVGPLVRFMANLLNNPSKTAIDEAYLFLEACKLPITEDGYFIAYKIVNANYKDIYTGKMDNSVGKVLEMPRFQVDDNRNNTCSAGLHFCSKEYLSHYGSSSRETDRAMLVKINPADIVSIPSDYNNAKGRAWRYEVVGEVPAGWRNTLPKEDYTAAPVVSKVGVTLPKISLQQLWNDNFEWSVEDGVVWTDSFRPAQFKHVMSRLSNNGQFSIAEIDAFISAVKNKAQCTEVQENDPADFGYSFSERSNRWMDEDGNYVSRWSVATECGLTIDQLGKFE
jgi:aspartate 1-decarboxylase